MPRGSGGVYTLPAGNPVVSGTVIASSWANPTMDDLGAALTDSLSRTGNGGMQAAFKNINGVETSPADTFNNDPLTGRYLEAVGDMRDTVSGVDQVRYTPQGLSVTDGEGGWIPVLGSGSGAILIQTDFTDVAGQTVFTTAEANSSADAYINGSLLANDDYTFTLGNTITLVEPVKNASDVVSILGYGAFDISDPAGAREAIDVYSTEESDAGNKNYLINGDMSVWQRGEDFTSPSNVYTVDRWKVSNSVSQALKVNSPINGQTRSALRLTTDTTSVRLLQGVELTETGLAAPFSLGGTYTLSGMIFAEVGTTVTAVGIWRDTTNSGTNQVIEFSELVLTGDGAWQKFEFTFTLAQAPVATSKTFDISFDSALMTGGDHIYFTQVQLNSGAIAKPFIYTPIGETLALCQRYYEVGGVQNNGLAGSVFDAYVVPFIVTKRSNDITMDITDITEANCTGTNGDFPTSSGFRYVCSTGASGQFTNSFNWTADAEL